MIEIRFHGRGGQGAVTSVELLALAAIEEGKFAQGFPSFGPERRGAPVMAFCRVDDKHIRLRCKILQPDVVVVLDASLLQDSKPAGGPEGKRHHRPEHRQERRGNPPGIRLQAHPGPGGRQQDRPGGPGGAHRQHHHDRGAAPGHRGGARWSPWRSP